MRKGLKKHLGKRREYSAILHKFSKKYDKNWRLKDTAVITNVKNSQNYKVADHLWIQKPNILKRIEEGSFFQFSAIPTEYQKKDGSVDYALKNLILI